MVLITKYKLLPFRVAKKWLGSLAFLVFGLEASSTTLQGQAPSTVLQNNEQCIPAASSYHDVNAAVLKAILMVESGLNAWEVRKNSNGTLDVGMAGPGHCG